MEHSNADGFTREPDGRRRRERCAQVRCRPIGRVAGSERAVNRRAGRALQRKGQVVIWSVMPLSIALYPIPVSGAVQPLQKISDS